MSMYTVLLSDQVHQLSPTDVNTLDLTPLGNNHYHFLSADGKSASIEVVDLDLDNALFKIRVDGQLYSGQIQMPIDNLIKQLGLDIVNTSATDKVLAPMPGLVLDIIATPGQLVTKGENLLILEAMKMENVIKSPVDGIIKSVEVSTGDPISKSQVLVTYETA